jgi:hypothetical protein
MCTARYGALSGATRASTEMMMTLDAAAAGDCQPLRRLVAGGFNVFQQLTEIRQRLG